jgi:hypothetical protein
MGRRRTKHSTSIKNISIIHEKVVIVKHVSYSTIFKYANLIASPNFALLSPLQQKYPISRFFFSKIRDFS